MFPHRKTFFLPSHSLDIVKSVEKYLPIFIAIG